MPLVLLLLLPVVVDIVRRPSFRNLAFRNIARRKGEALLVILGAMLGTAIITASFVVADAITVSIRDGVRTNVGPIDLSVWSQTDDPAADLDELLAKAGLEDAFAQLEHRSAPAVAATSGSDPVAEPFALLAEMDFDAARRFGGDVATTGMADAGATPEPGTAVVNEQLAGDLGVGEGDRIELFAYGGSVEVRVRTIVDEVGLAGYAPVADSGFGPVELRTPVFVAPGTIEELFASSDQPGATPPTREVLLSSGQGAFGAEPELEAWGDRLDRAVRAMPGSGLSVSETKIGWLDAAEVSGKSIGELYFGVGMFGVLAGVLLLVNLFVMLSEERKVELGMLRAIGLRRNHLLRIFGIEGAVYSVAAAVLGAGLGVGVGWGINRIAASIVSADEADFSVRFSVRPSSVLAGATIGLTISLVTVWATSFRISRLNVIRAIRDLAEPTSRRQHPVSVIASMVGVFVGGAVSAVGVSSSDPVAAFGGPSLLLLCAIPLLRRWLPRRTAVVAPSVALLGWGIVGPSILPDVFVEITIQSFVIQGVSLVAASVIILSSADGMWRALGRLVAGSGKGLSTRLGLAYPLARPFRTGMLLAMYSLVIFTMVFLSVFSGLLDEQAPTITREVSVGHDVFVDSNPANPVTLDELAAVDGVSSVAPLVRAFPRFDPEWDDKDPRPWVVSGVDERFAALGSPKLISHDEELGSTDAEVYDAVLSDPSLALVPDFFLQTGGGGPPEHIVEVGEKITVVNPGGETHQVTIAGIISNDWVLNGVLLQDEFVREFMGGQAFENRHYVAVDEGADAEAVAARLNGEFIPRGADASTFQDEVESQLKQQAAFFALMRGYLGLGLVIGIAGLGVVMVRAVRERRRQIGMLRAMGVSSTVVRRAFLLEAAFIALQGSLLGIGLSLVTSYGLFTNSDILGEQATYVIPWGAIGTIFAVPFVSSLLATLAPAAQAAAIRPAVALRIAE